MVDRIDVPRPIPLPGLGETGFDKTSLGRTDAPGRAGESRGSLETAGETPPPRGARQTDAPTLPPPQAGRGAIGTAALTLASFRPAEKVDFTTLARVVQEENLLNRTAARETRAAARDADIAAQKAQADKIRSQAAFAFAAAVVSSSFAIAGAAVSLGGAAKAQGMINSGASQVEVQTLSTKFGSIGTVVGEVGKIAGAGLNFAGSREDADRVEEQAKASKARTLADDQSDFIRSYAENIQNVLQKLSAIQDAQSDSMRQIVRA